MSDQNRPYDIRAGYSSFDWKDEMASGEFFEDAAKGVTAAPRPVVSQAKPAGDRKPVDIRRFYDTFDWGM